MKKYMKKIIIVFASFMLFFGVHIAFASMPHCAVTDFSANPSTINNGQYATLSWTAINSCTSAHITSNTGYNYNIPSYYVANGSVNVNPGNTSNSPLVVTYTITASDANGASASVFTTVTVNPQSPNCTINNFYATPSTITSGQSTALFWNTTNCVTGYVDHGVGTVSGFPNGTKPLYGVTGNGVVQYTLTAQGYNGINATAIVNLTVNPNIVPMTGTLTSLANSCAILSGQSSCTIPFSWSVSNPPAGSFSQVTTNQNGNSVAVGNGNTGNNQSFTIPYNSATFYLYNSSILLASKSVSSSCVSGTSWNGTICSPQAANNCTISNFYASAPSVNTGGSTNLYWATSNCTSANISSSSGSFNYTIPSYYIPNGNTYVSNINSSTTYTLSATNSNGVPATSSVTVTIGQNQGCNINNFTVSPTSITSGQPVNINWNTSGCTSAIVSGSNFSSTSLSNSQTIYPTSSGNYTINVLSSSGQYIVPQSVYVTVNGNNNQYGNCVISSFTASPTSINYGGSTNISWNASGCSQVYVSGPNFSSSSAIGSQNVYPTSSTNYTLTAYNQNGTSQTQSLYVYVGNNYYGNSYYYPGSNLYCSIFNFYATPASISSGGSSVLNWSTNCSQVNISGLGNVATSGSQIVYPTNTTSYTLNAYGQGSTPAPQTVQVYVINNSNPAPVYNTCAVTTVATNITKDGVTLNGLISDPNSSNDTAYFEYGSNVDLGLQTVSKSTSGNSMFNENLSGLLPSTIYYYRMVANCGGTTSYGSTKIFETLNSAGYEIPEGSDTITKTKVIVHGNTVSGTNSPVLLKIENHYQLVKVGDSTEYTITYKNIGSKKITNSILQVVLPKGITFEKASAGGFSQSTNTLTVQIGDLIPNQDGTVYLEGKVDSIEAGSVQIVTTAIFVYTNEKGSQENAMAYVLNTASGVETNSTSSIAAIAIFGFVFNLGIIGWLILIILILLIILIIRKYFMRR